MKNKKILLTGFRCVGKSHIGKIISKEMKYKFFDTDSLVLRDMKCKDISEATKDGWQNFRANEYKVFKRLLKFNGNSIIACGGGIGVNDIPINDSDMKFIQDTMVYNQSIKALYHNKEIITYGEMERNLLHHYRNTTAILITMNCNGLRKRLYHYLELNPTHRPNVNNTKYETVDETVEYNINLFLEREHLYYSFANHVIDISHIPREAVVEKILDIIK